MAVKSILLMIFFVLSMNVMPRSAVANPVNAKSNSAQSVSKAKNSEPSDAKYLGYSVDGRTSASVLAAQRSHTVAGKDERDFAIFTGLVVIFIIIFLSKIEFYDK